MKILTCLSVFIRCASIIVHSIAGIIVSSSTIVHRTHRLVQTQPSRDIDHPPHAVLIKLLRQIIRMDFHLVMRVERGYFQPPSRLRPQLANGRGEG